MSSPARRLKTWGSALRSLAMTSRSPSSLVALTMATLRVHRSRKSYPPANHRKPSFSSLKAQNLPKVQIPLASVALNFLDSAGETEDGTLKLGSFSSNPWGFGLEAQSLRLGSSHRICQKTDKKGKDCTLTITIPLGEGCIDK